MLLKLLAKMLKCGQMLLNSRSPACGQNHNEQREHDVEEEGHEKMENDHNVMVDTQPRRISDHTPDTLLFVVVDQLPMERLMEGSDEHEQVHTAYNELRCSLTFGGIKVDALVDGQSAFDTHARTQPITHIEKYANEKIHHGTLAQQERSSSDHTHLRDDQQIDLDSECYADEK